MRRRFSFLCALLLASGLARAAGPAPFTTVDTAYREGVGNIEMQNAFTYNSPMRQDSHSYEIDAEHEFYIGIGDNFDIALGGSYHYEHSRDGGSQMRFDDAFIEGNLFLFNPNVDPLGVAIFGEVAIGENALSFEQKLVLHKDWDNWTIAYNLSLETGLDGVFTNHPGGSAGGGVDVEGSITNALGVTYRFTPRLAIGGEVSAESVYANWSSYEGTTVFAGPVASYIGGRNWWITFSPQFQVTGHGGEPDFQVNLLFGIFF